MSHTDAGAATTAAGERREPVRLGDLGATVYTADVPESLVAELPTLYSSCYSVIEYFQLFDHPASVSACVLDAPRHVVLYTVRGATADVLNKRVAIEPASVARVAAALFRIHRRVRRIRAEVLFAPDELSLPVRVHESVDDHLLDLPASEEEYRGTIGNTTRKHLQQYANKLRRECPAFTLRVLQRQEITPDLVELVVEWNKVRIRAKGAVSGYEKDPEASGTTWKLLQHHGLAICGYDGDDCVAAQLLLAVGDDVWVHTIGADARYERLHIGMLMSQSTVIESIARGFKRVHFGWGTAEYKRRLGATPCTAHRVSVFRSALQKRLYSYEAWQTLYAERRRLYWDARARLKRLVPGRAARRGASPGESGADRR